jgi:RNA polymerase sigma factor (sigma-70 family)
LESSQNFFQLWGSNLTKSATLKDVEQHITDCLRKNDVHAGVRLIVGHFHEQLYWAIRKWVLVHEDANDVLQLTYIRIYKGLGKFAFKSAVKTWCYRIAYNEAMRFLESNKKRVRIPEEAMTYRLENLFADPYFDADAADASLQRIIAELDENQREVFCMKYYDELKFSEIAQITNRNENSVKTLFYKAKEILSNQIVLS